MRRGSHVTIAALFLAVVGTATCSGNGDDAGPRKAPAPPPASTTMGPQFPDARTEVTGAFWDGKIAVAGGLTPQQSTDHFDLFDVAAGTWSPGPTLPHHYDHASLAELDGRLYIVGGYTAGLTDPTSDVFSIGPGESSWVPEPGMAIRRGALATAASSGKLVAVGGVDENGNVLTSTEILTPGVGWSPGPRLNTPREHLAAAVAGDKVYAIAGRNGSGTKRSVESLIVGTDQWNSEPPVHDARSGIGAATTASGRMCTGGGEVPGKPDTVPTIECYFRGRWRRVATLQVPRHGLAVVAEGDRVHFVAGGPQPGATYSDAHEVLAV